MIIESLVTTLDAEGAPNFAPMGVEWAEHVIVLKPYRETTTFRNIVGSGEAVVNLVDEVGFFVESALQSPRFPAHPAAVVRGVVLQAACSWRELRVSEADTREARARFTCAVVHSGFKREFIGFSRARAAVLEATILATRTRILPMQEIVAEYRRLQTIVDKTAGPPEREAMATLGAFVERERAALEADKP